MIARATRRRAPTLLVLAVAVALAGGSSVSLTAFAAPQADVAKTVVKAKRVVKKAAARAKTVAKAKTVAVRKTVRAKAR